MVTAGELFKEQKEREEKRKKIFKKVYKLVERRIVEASKINSYQCYYNIPNFVMNVPLYSLEDCRNYIIDKLKKNDFKVELINQNVILISWNK